MKFSAEDVLNALVTDPVADQVRRALELGYSLQAVEDAVSRGMGHGVDEFHQGQAMMKGAKNERG